LCKNGYTDRFTAWFVDSGGQKEAQAQSYLPGGANVPSSEGTLAQHWRNLANTIEPSVCGGDVALCQMTLTTCWFTAK